MYFEICKWNVKPILMDLVYKTNDRMDFLINLNALIQLIELENNIKVTEKNIWEYIHISELESNLSNKELLDYLENESLKNLDNLKI